jgi:hypothetical protein
MLLKTTDLYRFYMSNRTITYKYKYISNTQNIKCFDLLIDSIFGIRYNYSSNYMDVFILTNIIRMTVIIT